MPSGAGADGLRIAFYAPLKSPRHPVPSGDRYVARMLMAALRRAGHHVQLASSLRSFDGRGDAARQARIRDRAIRRAGELTGRYRQVSAPALWFTYHPYHKAPDWIGPAVSARLGIPYVVAEASVAGKQREGPWAEGHARTVAALRRADAVLALNPADVEGVAPLVATGRLHLLKPFIDLRVVAPPRPPASKTPAQPPGWHAGVPHLATVAMMRPGDKLRSYRILADAMRLVRAPAWQLVVIGDGSARDQVERAFAGLQAGRVLYAGRLGQPEVIALLSRCDLFVWPAVNEAFGMALLEAQACGLPVVAGRCGGVANVVAAPRTGLLVEAGDAGALAGAVTELLADPVRRRAMGRRAREHVRAHHGLDAASARLNAVLQDLVGPAAR